MGKRVLIIEPLYHLEYTPGSEKRMMKSTLLDQGNAETIWQCLFVRL